MSLRRRNRLQPCATRRKSGSTSISRRELPDRLEDLRVVRWHARVFRDPLVSDDALPVEDEDGALRHARQTETPEAVVEDAVRLAHGPVPVAEERVVDAVLLLEDAMAVMAVRADAEHLRAVRS